MRVRLPSVCLSGSGLGLGLSWLRKRGGVRKFLDHKVPLKIGMLIYLLVTSRPLTVLQKEAFYLPVVGSLCSTFYLPVTPATHEMEDPFATPKWPFQAAFHRRPGEQSLHRPSTNMALGGGVRSGYSCSSTTSCQVSFVLRLGHRWPSTGQKANS